MDTRRRGRAGRAGLGVVAVAARAVRGPAGGDAGRAPDPGPGPPGGDVLGGHPEREPGPDVRLGPRSRTSARSARRGTWPTTAAWAWAPPASASLSCTPGIRWPSR